MPARDPWGLVELQIDEHERSALGHRVGPAQQGADPCDELLDAERLGDVVVASEREPAHLVLDGVARREEQDRHLHAIGGEPFGDREPVHVGEHHVEHDQRRSELSTSFSPARPVPAVAT